MDPGASLFPGRLPDDTQDARKIGIPLEFAEGLRVNDIHHADVATRDSLVFTNVDVSDVIFEVSFIYASIEVQDNTCWSNREMVQ